jgi:hypothetical protein
MYSKSEVIYTFFHPILRDQKQNNPLQIDYTSDNPEPKVRGDSLLMNKDDSNILNTNRPDIKGHIKIKLSFKDNKFTVNCLHCRNLVI